MTVAISRDKADGFNGKLNNPFTQNARSSSFKKRFDQ